jgi:hydrogenase-4 component F
MSSIVFVLVPALASLSVAARTARERAVLVLLGVAAIAAALAVTAVVTPFDLPLVLGGFVRADATSRLFMAVVNPIFLGISVYVWHRVHTTPALHRSIGRYVGLALLFLAASNAVLLANHLVALWIALEATTLAAAPLIVRPGVRSSRRASFRFLLFSSVGLGMVLLGFTCLGRGMEADGQVPTFFLDRLLALGASPANPWTKLGLALVLLGLGTKLGLAPMYSWLPEAYDEAPPAVAALLGAIQFNCALVVLFRVLQVYRAGNAALVAGELLTMGIVSMVVSTLSIMATRNMKRLIAYASINHAGVIAIGLGVGRSASYGLLLYVLCNAFIKAILFLTAGKIEAHHRTRDTRAISGLIKDLPYSGVFLMVGTFALLGFPPFGSFFGELLILSALVGSGQMLVFAAFCVLITMTFVATGRTVFPMIWGEPREKHGWPPQTLPAALPKLAFLVALVVLGIYIPPGLNSLIQQVAASLEGP